jgi:hypothetical protein
MRSTSAIKAVRSAVIWLRSISMITQKRKASAFWERKPCAVCGVIRLLPALSHLGGRRVGSEELGEPAQGREHGVGCHSPFPPRRFQDVARGTRSHRQQEFIEFLTIIISVPVKTAIA